MELEISHEVTQNLELASKKLGLNKSEIIKRAIKFYLHNLVEEALLNEELKAWENAGTIDAENFNRRL